MRNSCRVLLCGLSLSLVLGLAACAAKKPMKGHRGTAPELETATPMPTVPPTTPTPEVTPAPLKTRPVGKDVKATKDHPVGPEITFFGAARADGSTVEPTSVEKGIPVYRSEVGSGFLLVVEAKPGENGYDPGRSVFAHMPGDPKVRPDLEIETSRDMGDGSREVCDRMRPHIGGMPGISPPNYAETQQISDAINDFSCRFEAFIESEGSCTLNKSGDYSFVNKETTTQFCMLVARAYAFPVGKTLLSVRLRDSEGSPGPVKQMWVFRPVKPAPPKPRPAKKESAAP